MSQYIITAGAMGAAYKLTGFAGVVLGKAIEAAAERAFYSQFGSNHAETNDSSNSEGKLGGSNVRNLGHFLASSLTSSNDDEFRAMIRKHSPQYILMEMDCEAKVQYARSLINKIRREEMRKRTNAASSSKDSAMVKEVSEGIGSGMEGNALLLKDEDVDEVHKGGSAAPSEVDLSGSEVDGTLENEFHHPLADSGGSGLTGGKDGYEEFELVDERECNFVLVLIDNLSHICDQIASTLSNKVYPKMQYHNSKYFASYRTLDLTKELILLRTQLLVYETRMKNLIQGITIENVLKRYESSETNEVCTRCERSKMDLVNDLGIGMADMPRIDLDFEVDVDASDNQKSPKVVKRSVKMQQSIFEEETVIL